MKDEDEDGDEDGDDSMSSAVSSSEEGEEVEEEAVQAVASDRNTSDDDDDDDDGDDDDGDDGSSSCCSNGGGMERRSTGGKRRAKETRGERAKKRRVEEPAALPAFEAERVAAARAELAARDAAATEALREVAGPGLRGAKDWAQGSSGQVLSAKRKAEVLASVENAQQAASPTALVSHLACVALTLVAAHRDHLEGETCEVPTAHVKRLHSACTLATQFSEATMEELDGAIAGLTKARDLGRKALEFVAPPRVDAV